MPAQETPPRCCHLGPPPPLSGLYTPCDAVARFVIFGTAPSDCSYGCGDHAESLRGDGEIVMRMSDGLVIPPPRRS